MKFQYVQQKHKSGCAVACIAMVLGRGYDEIEKQLQNDFEKHGLSEKDVANFIADHGCSVIQKKAWGYMDIRASNRRMAEPYADIHIVSVMPYSNARMGHSIVMDDGGRVYDPQYPEIKDFSQYYSIDSILGFYYEKVKTMPLPKARKGAKKKARQKVVSKVMHELSTKGSKKRSQKQKVAIALKQAGLSRRKKK